MRIRVKFIVMGGLNLMLVLKLELWLGLVFMVRTSARGQARSRAGARFRVKFMACSMGKVITRFRFMVSVIIRFRIGYMVKFMFG